jgi:hypothetical protein
MAICNCIETKLVEYENALSDSGVLTLAGYASSDLS